MDARTSTSTRTVGQSALSTGHVDFSTSTRRHRQCGRYPGPRSARPGRASVMRPSDTTSLAVDDHVLHADRVVVRILERRDVVNRRRIEHDDVGGEAGAQDAAIAQPDARCRPGTSSSESPPRASAASRRARTCRGCARTIPQPRGCALVPANGPSSARSCESVPIDTRRCASAARTSSSRMIAMMHCGVAVVGDDDDPSGRRAGPSPSRRRSR